VSRRRRLRTRSRGRSPRRRARPRAPPPARPRRGARGATTAAGAQTLGAAAPATADAELWRTAFELGAERTVELPARGELLVDLLAEVVDGRAPRSDRGLAVLGGCGGAGASVLAAATATTAARRGDEALLVDADPLGGGLDLALGTESADGLRWSGLAVSGGRIAAGALQQALPRHELAAGRVSVLACDRGAAPAGLTTEAARQRHAGTPYIGGADGHAGRPGPRFRRESRAAPRHDQMDTALPPYRNGPTARRNVTNDSTTQPQRDLPPAWSPGSSSPTGRLPAREPLVRATT
jgi:hypothetical protein